MREGGQREPDNLKPGNLADKLRINPVRCVSERICFKLAHTLKAASGLGRRAAKEDG